LFGILHNKSPSLTLVPLGALDTQAICVYFHQLHVNKLSTLAPLVDLGARRLQDPTYMVLIPAFEKYSLQARCFTRGTS
jgi:hypothetical protein